MKKIIIGIVLLIIGSVLFAGELNSYATTLKTDFTEYYTPIKERAVKEWGTDHEMVLYEINKQSEAFFTVMDLLQSNPMITFEAMIEWCDTNLLEYTDNSLIAPMDWAMVVYTTNNQIKAASSY